MKDGKVKNPKDAGQYAQSQNRLIGRVLGKYRLVRPIGSGAFASIYEAVHIHLNVPFAIKILHPAFMNHEEVVSRFFREAQAASQLQHENVVFIADFDVEEDVGPYIVMEYLEGRTLKSLLEEEGALPLELVGELSRQISQVLALAHRKGIVHRDLKPENIFLVAREMGRVLTKILDFGIAHLSQGSESITGAKLMGTPIYMAPEQFRGSAHSSSIDIYSFGVILYEMLTGEPPFKGKNVQQLGIEHLLVPAPDLAHSFPAGLRQLQARLLGKTSDERPSDMTEVWDLLAPSLDPDGRYPHWHCQEPRFTSASMPAASSIMKKADAKSSVLDTLNSPRHTPSPGDTWEGEVSKKSSQTEEKTQSSFDARHLSIAKEDNRDMSDTIMSDEHFELPQKLQAKSSETDTSQTLTPEDKKDTPLSLHGLEEEQSNLLVEDEINSVITDDDKDKHSDNEELSELLGEEEELQPLIISETDSSLSKRSSKMQRGVTGEIKVVEQSLEDSDWEKEEIDTNKTEIVRTNDLNKEILEQQDHSSASHIEQSQQATSSYPTAMSEAKHSSTPFPPLQGGAFPPLQGGAFPPLIAENLASNNVFPSLVAENAPENNIMLENHSSNEIVVSTNEESSALTSEKAKIISGEATPNRRNTPSAIDTLESVKNIADSKEQSQKQSLGVEFFVDHEQKLTSQSNDTSQQVGFFGKIKTMGIAEKRILIVVWLGVVFVLVGVTILLVPELNKAGHSKKRHAQRFILKAQSLKKDRKRIFLKALKKDKKQRLMRRMKKEKLGIYRHLWIETIPTKARIYINNKFVGRTPFRIKRPIHWIFKAKIRLKGYRTKKIIYQMDESENKKLFYKLKID